MFGYSIPFNVDCSFGQSLSLTLRRRCLFHFGFFSTVNVAIQFNFLRAQNNKIDFQFSTF